MHWLGKAQRIVLFMFTFSYYGSLRHYTLDRLLEIEQHQHDIEFVKVLLKNFKRRKVEELQLVRKGAALSAAIVIGTFSWPNSSEAFWLSRLFWYNSLWFSVFALVGFSHQRLIDALPGKDCQSCPDAIEENHVRSTLLLLLRQCSNKRRQDPEVGHSKEPRFVFDWALAYAWQSPLMLLSYSWLSFLLGYGVYLLSPVLPTGRYNFDIGCVSIEIGVGLLAYINFEITSKLARRAVRQARHAAENANAKELSNESDTNISIMTEETRPKAMGT